MTRVLAVDSSTEALAAALVLPGALHPVDGDAGAQASGRLVPVALDLLARSGTTLADLDAIAFGRGPGAFTGLRVAASVAQGLALGAGKPVVPVDSLMIVADDARAQGGGDDIAVAMDARMDEVYAARYRWDGAHWTVLDAPALRRPDELLQHWASAAPPCVAGSALEAFGERLPLPPGARAVPRTASRAAALGRLAALGWVRGEAVDAALALPVYLRDKVAQTTAEREAERTRKAAAP